MKRMALIVLVCVVTIPFMTSAQSQSDTTYDFDPKFDKSIMYRGPDGVYRYRVNLPEETKRELEERAKVIVATFNTNLKRLWERRLPLSDPYYQREKLKIDSATRRLFVGDADYYFTTDSAEYDVDRDDEGYYYEPEGNKGKVIHRISDTRKIYYRDSCPLIKVMETRGHRPVNIYISSIRNPQGNPQRVTSYLRKARTNVTYEYVEFNAEGYTPSSNLQPVSGKPGVYEGTITYIQKFRGIRGDGRKYCDETYRTVTYEVRLVTEGGVPYWDIKLRDILATDTKSLK